MDIPHLQDLLEQALDELRQINDPSRVPRVKSTWRVTTRPPRGRDGKNWQLRFFPPPGEGRPGKEGKPYQRSAGTRDGKEAARIADAEERRLNGSCLPLSEVARLYLAFRSTDGETRPSSVLRCRHALDAFQLHLRGQGVTRESVLGVQDAMRPRLAPVTINNYMGMVGRAWAWARDRGLVDTDWPKTKRLRQRKTDLRPCTHGETGAILERFMGHGEGHYYGFFVLVHDVGSRTGETCALRERDLDRQRDQVTFWRTKTDSRTVCVSPGVLSLIPVQADPDELAFRGRRGGALTRNSVYVAWRAVLRKLEWEGLPITPHSLRRSWITDSLREGVPITQSMRHTGHRTTAVHLDYQRNAPDEGMAQVAATVRACRPPLPHTLLAEVGGVELESPATEEVTGVTRSGCAREDLDNMTDSSTLRHDTPHRRRSREILARLVTVGGDVRAALVALARVESLRAWLIDLDKREPR